MRGNPVFNVAMRESLILMPGLPDPSCVFFLGCLYTFLPATLSQLSKEYSEAALSEKNKYKK